MSLKDIEFFCRVKVANLAYLDANSNSTKKIQVSCSTNIENQVFLGGTKKIPLDEGNPFLKPISLDTFGNIHVLHNDLKVHRTIQAFEKSVSYLGAARNKALLISIGEDEAPMQKFKIWRYDNNELQLFFSSAISQKDQIGALDCTSDLSHIAFGLEKGRISILYGGISRTQTNFKKFTKDDEALPIASLYFAEYDSNWYLYVITDSSIGVYRVYANSFSEKKILATDLKCDVNCCCITENGSLAVASDDAIHVFNPEGKVGSLECRAKKLILKCFSRYFVCVQNNFKENIFFVYEPTYKFVVYSQKFSEIHSLVCGTESIFVITGDSKVHQLSEISAQDQLELFLQRNSYEFAITYFKNFKFDKNLISEVCKHYGDELYARGDYNGAILQYIQTIGFLESSYVIKKFLDIQQIPNLVQYLEVFCVSGSSSPDHNALLLSCYIKMNDHEKIDYILSQIHLEFDFQVAIDALRHAGYYYYALILAKNKNNHEWYIKILFEDKKEYEEALNYITSLDPVIVVDSLLKYGKILISDLPQVTISALLKFWPLYRREYLGIGGNTIRGIQEVAEGFISVLINQPEYLARFLEMVVYEGQASPYLCHTLLELHLCAYEKISGENSNAEKSKREAILKLLNFSQLHADGGHGLSLCQLHGFEPGISYYFERAEELRPGILEHYMSSGRSEQIIRHCKHYMDDDPYVWLQVLEYLSNFKDPNISKYLQDALGHIERKNLLSPLQVFSAFANSEIITLDMVEKYICNRFLHQQRKVKEASSFIAGKREEAENYSRKITEARSIACVFNRQKCDAQNCGRELVPPAIYFLCSHAFHRNCLEQTEYECPICACEFNRLKELRSAFESKAHEQDEFFKILEMSEDGFSVGSEYFGRGIFGIPHFEEEDSNADEKDISNIFRTSQHKPDVNNGDGGIIEDLEAIIAKFLQ